MLKQLTYLQSITNADLACSIDARKAKQLIDYANDLIDLYLEYNSKIPTRTKLAIHNKLNESLRDLNHVLVSYKY